MSKIMKAGAYKVEIEFTLEEDTLESELNTVFEDAMYNNFNDISSSNIGTYVSTDVRMKETLSGINTEKEETYSLYDVQQTMLELDNAIWRKFYPFSEMSDCKNLDVVGMWLKANIEYILLDEEMDAAKAKEDILSMIQATAYADIILNKFICFDELMEAVQARSDYETALKKYTTSKLSNLLGYGFSKKDLTKLAELHAAGICCTEIEELLTNCNFHSECGKFINGEYDDFLEENLEEER